MAKFELVNPRHPHAAPIRFRDFRDARETLTKAATDTDNMAGFRTVWKDARRDGGRGAVPSDRVILDDLARLLVEGELRTRRAVGGTGGGSDQDDGGYEAPSQYQPIAKASEPPLKIRPRPEPSSAPPPTNVAQQVQALEQAAESGAPFCEQCQKAAE